MRRRTVLLGVSFTSPSPWTLLYHCRSVSTRDTMAIGTWKMLQSCKLTRQSSMNTQKLHDREERAQHMAYILAVCGQAGLFQRHMTGS